MSNIILTSPLRLDDKGEWPTPTRAVVRACQRDGLSQREIVKKTDVPRRTIRRILHQESSRRGRRGKAYKPHLMSIREIHRCIRHISRDWSTRRLSFA